KIQKKETCILTRRDSFANHITTRRPSGFADHYRFAASGSDHPLMPRVNSADRILDTYTFPKWIVVDHDQIRRRQDGRLLKQLTIHIRGGDRHSRSFALDTLHIPDQLLRSEVAAKQNFAADDCDIDIAGANRRN